LQEFNKIVENTLTNVVDMIDKWLVTLSRNTIAREIEHKKKIPEIIIDIQTVLSSEQYAMFHNVLTNAIKYWWNNISVKSQLHKTQQGVVVIEIQDNGEGIELNKAKNILQWENVESSDHEHGHGIWLATTARLLKNKFKIEKGINGKYNTFVLEFTLPVGGKL
jgi:K+-sensing histidine kinase KdpD